MTFGHPTPILRSFDEARAKAFYLDFLGFELVFEHRFKPGLPLYFGVRRETACSICRNIRRCLARCRNPDPGR